MTTLADLPGTRPALTRRQRAARTVNAALRGALIGTAAATIAWLIAGALSATAFVVLVVATVALGAYTLMRDDVQLALWGALAAGWAIVMLERWAVQEHGGVWVAAAAWLGVVIGARRAEMSKWSMPLLAYPALCAAIVVAAGEDLLDPWDVSWLWVLAVLGPVVGARTLLQPRESEPQRPAGQLSR